MKQGTTEEPARVVVASAITYEFNILCILEEESWLFAVCEYVQLAFSCYVDHHNLALNFKAGLQCETCLFY